MKKYILVILSILLLTGCELDFTTSKRASDKLAEGAYMNIKEDIKIFSEVKAKDIIDTNVEINNDINLDTEHIGENTAVIDYSYNGKKYKYNFKYNVTDDVKPIFLSASQNVTLLVHDDTNPCDSINIADNYSKIPTCEIVGDYNMEKVGTYNVKYVISDESGNTNEKNLTINYVQELPKKNNNPSNPSTSYVSFDWVKQQFKTDKTELGLDISRWQGDLTVENFEQIKNAGATFIMMRLGVSNKPDEELAVDSKYRNNIKNAKAAGLKVGVYVYTAAINDDMAKTLARFMNDTLDGEKLDFPVVFDWENWSKFRSYQISIHDLNNTFVTFANEMKKYGYDSMVYGSKHYLEIMWEDRIKDNYPVWLAHYTNSQTNYEGKYMMWQMCSDGRIDGIQGDVDVDILYK